MSRVVQLADVFDALPYDAAQQELHSELDHPWPGNVREMLNTLRRAAVWTPGPLIDADDARDALLPSPDIGPGKDPILAQDVRQGIDITALIDRVARH